jgi:galactokinase/mevalonate kinase-like predicted kinase
MVSNETVEELLTAVDPHVYGRRLPGAGSGGFLFMICRSPADAAAVREKLGRKPFNERSRFFDYEVNGAGLEVTTC